MNDQKSRTFSPDAPLYAVGAVLFLSVAAWEYAIADSIGDIMSANITVSMALMAIGGMFLTGTKKGFYKGWWYFADAPTISRCFFIAALALIIGSLLTSVFAAR